MTTELKKQLALNDGKKIPVMGFGTAELTGHRAEESVVYAIKEGYRLIDTSPNYGNEKEVGNALMTVMKDGIDREELFIVTKIEPEDMTASKALDSINESLERLNLNYLDLILIHAPDEDSTVNSDTWKGLEEACNSKKVRSIGVSNFTKNDLEKLFNDIVIKPSINQYELYPGKVDWETKEFCEKHSIPIMAYSPLKKGNVDKQKQLESIAKKYEKTSAQVALRWALELNTIPIPRSGNKDHIIENTKIFDFSLSNEETNMINALN